MIVSVPRELFQTEIFIFGEWRMKIWKLLQNNRLCSEIIAFMRFSTSETSRYVVLDLKLAWLLLEALTFADFQERMSSLLCCKVLIDEWCQEIMAIFYHQFLIPYDFSSIVWWCEALFLDPEFSIPVGPLGDFLVSKESRKVKENEEQIVCGE